MAFSLLHSLQSALKGHHSDVYHYGESRALIYV